MLNSYKVVMYMQRSYRFFNIHTPDDGSRSGKNTKEQLILGSLLSLPDTIKSMWRLEKINIIIRKQRKSILFNKICINKEMLSKYTHTHTHTYTYTNKTQIIYNTKFKTPNIMVKNNTNVP